MSRLAKRSTAEQSDAGTSGESSVAIPPLQFDVDGGKMTASRTEEASMTRMRRRDAVKKWISLDARLS
jgi:hypothetical protein